MRYLIKHEKGADIVASINTDYAEEKLKKMLGKSLRIYETTKINAVEYRITINGFHKSAPKTSKSFSAVVRCKSDRFTDVESLKKMAEITEIIDFKKEFVRYIF